MYKEHETFYPDCRVQTSNLVLVVYIVVVVVLSTGSENYLIREFGLTVVTRALTEKLLSDLDLAFNAAQTNGTWNGLVNVYDYFMRGTEAWFNGATLNVNLGK